MNPDTDFPNLKATLAGNGSHVEWPAMREEVRRVFALLSEGTKWIPVTERLPEFTNGDTSIPVIAVLGGRVGFYCYAYNPYAKTEKGKAPRFKNMWSDGASPVTHWMPLPEAPK
jgi:hypothetical protein